MEFKDIVSQVRKRFLDISKKYYKDKNLIAKMILLRGIYDNIYECDIYFRACMLNKFSDKYVNKICNKNVRKAVDLLRARARGCVYINLIINAIIDDNIVQCENSTGIVKQLQDIKQELYSLANESISYSNILSKENDLPLFECDEIKDGNISLYKYL